jgi:hypothetical protein
MEKYLHSPGGIMNRFRTRLITAAAVSAMLFGGVVLLATQSADSQPLSAEGTDAATGPAVACARSIEPDGYYQAEYAARRRCGRPVTQSDHISGLP